MGKALIGALIGLIVGGGLVFYLFVGVPQANQVPGTPIQPPDANGVPAGTAQIVLRQEFFNDLLGTIFGELNEPTFPLSTGSGSGAPDCSGNLTILKEGSGVQTGVRFDEKRLMAPMAFSGAYASPFGCVRFTGWAQTAMEMRYDAQQKQVFGQINVETVNLDGINPLVGAIVTPVVQSTLNARVNPVRILAAEQVAINTPVAAVDGNLIANVSDVRAEVKDSALNLYVVYDFGGVPNGAAPQASTP